MIAYAESLEAELDEKQGISREELRSYFAMEDQHFTIKELQG